MLQIIWESYTCFSSKVAANYLSWWNGQINYVGFFLQSCRKWSKEAGRRKSRNKSADRNSSGRKLFYIHTQSWAHATNAATKWPCFQAKYCITAILVVANPCTYCTNVDIKAIKYLFFGSEAQTCCVVVIEKLTNIACTAVSILYNTHNYFIFNNI